MEVEYQKKEKKHKKEKKEKKGEKKEKKKRKREEKKEEEEKEKEAKLEKEKGEKGEGREKKKRKKEKRRKEEEVKEVEEVRERVRGFEVVELKKGERGEKWKREGGVPNWMKSGRLIGEEEKPLSFLSGIVSEEVLEGVRKEMGVEKLFGVQWSVIPSVLQAFNKASDVVVSSPTGSGKTLSFAIPIVETLRALKPKLLRALIVLPTRDLALQVFSVVDKIASQVGLVTVAACGKFSFSKEQKQLLQAKNFAGKQEESEEEEKEGEVKEGRVCFVSGGNCKADILVCTPGRLTDHLKFTKGFTLEHLKFVVLDEADRLLTQSYQDFFSKLLKASHFNPNTISQPNPNPNPTQPNSPSLPTSLLQSNSGIKSNEDHFSLSVRTERTLNSVKKNLLECPLQKLIFSATVSHNPRKLKSLQLQNPLFFKSSSEGREYSLPSSLRQFRVISLPNEKTLVLSVLLNEWIEKGEQVLIFTSSLDSTHRLFTVLQLMNFPIKCSLYSSQLSQKERNQTLSKFRESKIQVLVCSDVMARGMDVLTVKNVINFDPPNHVKTYVHRVGRTARAGNEGFAFTLLTQEEDKNFLKYLDTKIEGKQPSLFLIPQERMQKYLPKFREALDSLRTELAKQKVIKINDPSFMEQQNNEFKQLQLPISTINHNQQENAQIEDEYHQQYPEEEFNEHYNEGEYVGEDFETNGKVEAGQDLLFDLFLKQNKF